MAALAPVDRLEVLILVDNVTDNLSSAPSFVEPEMGRLWRRGLRLWSGSSICYAAHGLSCLLTAYRGERVHSVLFDTGPEEAVFQRNVERLGVEMGKVEAMMLSHGHWDHGGGMLRALDLIGRLRETHGAQHLALRLAARARQRHRHRDTDRIGRVYDIARLTLKDGEDILSEARYRPWRVP